MAVDPVKFDLLIKERQRATWHAFYRMLTAGTYLDGPAAFYVPDLYYGYDPAALFTALQPLIADESPRTMFKDLLLELVTVIHDYDDQYGFLPYYGTDDVEKFFEYSIQKELQAAGETMLTGLDALDSMYNLLGGVNPSQIDNMFEYDQAESIIQAYPFEQIAVHLGGFFRQHVIMMGEPA